MVSLRLCALAAVAAALLVTCTPAHAPAPAGPRSARNVLTYAEIETEGYVTHTLLGAVERLRREFLTKRRDPQQGVVVYLGMTRLGGVSELALISAASVRTVEYVDAMGAFQRFGPPCVCGSGVLVVTLR